MKHNRKGDGLIYLAAPYTDDNPDIMAARKSAVDIWTLAMMQQGHPVLSPLTYETALKETGFNFPSAEEWYRYDRQLMQTCDRLLIMGLPGWERSRGVNIELEHANENGMPIYLNGMGEHNRITRCGFPTNLPEEKPDVIIQLAAPYQAGPDNDRERLRAARAAVIGAQRSGIAFCIAAYRMTLERMGAEPDDEYWAEFARRFTNRTDWVLADGPDAEEQCPNVRQDIIRAKHRAIPTGTLSGQAG